MKKSIKCMALALALAMSMIPAFAFASAPKETFTPVIDEIQNPLFVEYDCNLNDNDIEKLYWVSSEFEIPPVLLTNREANSKYTWNWKLGRYEVKVEEEGRQELSNESKFTVTILNMSNLPVSYDLSYIANDCAFTSESADVSLNGSEEKQSILNFFGEFVNNRIHGELATVAKGQSISDDGVISITDGGEATANPENEWWNSTDYKATLAGAVNVILEDDKYDGRDLRIDRETGMKTAVAGNFNLRLYGIEETAPIHEVQELK